MTDHRSFMRGMQRNSTLYEPSQELLPAFDIKQTLFDIFAAVFFFLFLGSVILSFPLAIFIMLFCG